MVTTAKQPAADNDAAEIIKGERQRIAAELRKAVDAAVPQDPLAYTQGFRDGADFVAERVLGMLLSDVAPQG